MPSTPLPFHHRLNPLIWQQDRMRPQVRVRLLRTALAFYRFVDIRHLVVSDIVLTGSNAAFNYTRLSDLDVHLVVNFQTTPCPNWAENVFTTKKALWSADHAVSIHGHAVELYVEDAARPATSNGVYSILRGRWLRQPSPIPPAQDNRAVTAKVAAYRAEIDALLAAPEAAQIAAMIAQLRRLRQNGLAAGGEFSVENLTYKILRAKGCLDTLSRARRAAIDADLSL